MNSEIDYLMTLKSTGLMTYDDTLSAKSAMLREWLDTPVGTIYGLPAWGNIISEFKHDPTESIHVQVAFESRLLQKLAEDLPSLAIKGISFSELEFDLGQIAIQIPEGTISEKVKF